MIKIVVALAIERRWDITHLDMKTTFLHGDLGKEVLMQQPEGFVAPRKKHLFYKLEKPLWVQTCIKNMVLENQPIIQKPQF
jgi:hypothetical protein